MRVNFIIIMFAMVLWTDVFGEDRENALPAASLEPNGNFESKFGGSNNGQSPAIQLTAYERYKDLFQLTGSNYSKKVFGKTESWVVIFHENGSFATGWKSMAASLRGIVWVGVVNIEEEKDIFKTQNLKMKEIPPALVYHYGNKKVKMANVEAAYSPLEAKRKAVKTIPDIYQAISGTSVQPFLMDCFTTGLSRFPVILMQYAMPPPLFRAVALRFQKYFNFGLITNPSLDDLKVLGLQNIYFDFPSLIVMVTTDPINPQLNAIIYNTEEMGEMNYPNLVRFLFYVNNEYRYLLPGENQSNEEEVATMSDILKIEEERFQFVDENSKTHSKSKGSGKKHSKLKYKEEL